MRNRLHLGRAFALSWLVAVLPGAEPLVAQFPAASVRGFAYQGAWARANRGEPITSAERQGLSIENRFEGSVFGQIQGAIEAARREIYHPARVLGPDVVSLAAPFVASRPPAASAVTAVTMRTAREAAHEEFAIRVRKITRDHLEDFARNGGSLMNLGAQAPEDQARAILGPGGALDFLRGDARDVAQEVLINELANEIQDINERMSDSAEAPSDSIRVSDDELAPSSGEIEAVNRLGELAAARARPESLRFEQLATEARKFASTANEVSRLAENLGDRQLAEAASTLSRAVDLSVSVAGAFYNPSQILPAVNMLFDAFGTSTPSPDQLLLQGQQSILEAIDELYQLSREQHREVMTKLGVIESAVMFNTMALDWIISVDMQTCQNVELYLSELETEAQRTGIGWVEQGGKVLRNRAETWERCKVGFVHTFGTDATPVSLLPEAAAARGGGELASVVQIRDTIYKPIIAFAKKVLPDSADVEGLEEPVFEFSRLRSKLLSSLNDSSMGGDERWLDEMLGEFLVSERVIVYGDLLRRTYVLRELEAFDYRTGTWSQPPSREGESWIRGALRLLDRAIMQQSLMDGERLIPIIYTLLLEPDDSLPEALRERDLTALRGEAIRLLDANPLLRGNLARYVAWSEVGADGWEWFQLVLNSEGRTRQRAVERLFRDRWQVELVDVAGEDSQALNGPFVHLRLNGQSKPLAIHAEAFSPQSLLPSSRTTDLLQLRYLLELELAGITGLHSVAGSLADSDWLSESADVPPTIGLFAAGVEYLSVIPRR